MPGFHTALPGLADDQLLGPGCRQLRLGDGADRVHALQHDPLTRSGALEVGHRVGVIGVLRQASQHGRLGNGELLHGLAEVGLGRRRKPIRALTQKNLVEVDLQDAVFGQRLFHLKCQHDFFGLALHRALAGEQHGAHQLLGDGAGALGATAGQHGQGGACHALGINAVVLAKARVFHRQHRVLQPLGRARQRHVFAPLGAKLRDLHAIGGEHLQRQLGLVVDDAVNRRQVHQRSVG